MREAERSSCPCCRASACCASRSRWHSGQRATCPRVSTGRTTRRSVTTSQSARAWQPWALPAPCASDAFQQRKEVFACNDVLRGHSWHRRTRRAAPMAESEFRFDLPKYLSQLSITTVIIPFSSSFTFELIRSLPVNHNPCLNALGVPRHYCAGRAPLAARDLVCSFVLSLDKRDSLRSRDQLFTCPKIHCCYQFEH